MNTAEQAVSETLEERAARLGLYDKNLSQIFDRVEELESALSQVRGKAQEPVGEIYWDESAEWKLNMLCEPNVKQGHRLKISVVPESWPDVPTPLYFSGTTAPQPDAQQVAQEPMRYKVVTGHGTHYRASLVGVAEEFHHIWTPVDARIPFKAIASILSEVMERAVANGANSTSMPDEYVAVAHFLSFPEKYLHTQELP